MGGGERNVCHGVGVLAAADRRRHRFCPAGRLRLDDTYVGQGLPVRPEEVCPVDEGEFRDEPSGEEVVQEYDEVEDLQRGQKEFQSEFKIRSSPPPKKLTSTI